MGYSVVIRWSMCAAVVLICQSASGLTQPLTSAVGSVPTSIRLSKVELELEDDKANCRLHIKSSSGKRSVKSVLVPAPCGFHVDLKGTVRTVRDKRHTYLLMESSTRMNDLDCTTYLQSVRIRGGVVQLASVQSKLASCPPFQWEWQVFTGGF